MLLLNGDCIEEMQKLKDEGKQIDSVVTDPPYHLTSIVERYGKDGSAPAKDKDGLYQRQARGFMGKEWDGGDILLGQILGNSHTTYLSLVGIYLLLVHPETTTEWPLQ